MYKKLADTTFFDGLMETTSPGRSGEVRDAFVKNVDISLFSLVRLAGNTELDALYDRLVKYGTAAKADEMLRGYRPQNLADLINILRLGLRAPTYSDGRAGDKHVSLQDMPEDKNALIDTWERDGVSLKKQLEDTQQELRRLNKKRRRGLFGWLPFAKDRRRQAQYEYYYNKDLEKLIRERLEEQDLKRNLAQQ